MVVAVKASLMLESGGEDNFNDETFVSTSRLCKKFIHTDDHLPGSLPHVCPNLM